MAHWEKAGLEIKTWFLGSKSLNKFFPENGHIAYQIERNEA